MSAQLATVEPQQGRGLTPTELLSQAMASGAGVDTMERLMAMQERWEAREAQRAYLAAFAKFKESAVRIVRSRLISSGPLEGKSHADLHGIVSAVTGPLSENGLSATWQITKDDPEWIAVRCTVRHVAGHSEHVEMGGPPDKGGAKNAVQARASTVTYLERYTLKAALGLAEEDDDDDGGQHPDWTQEWRDRIDGADDLAALELVGIDIAREIISAKDRAKIRPLYDLRRNALRGGK